MSLLDQLAGLLGGGQTAAGAGNLATQVTSMLEQQGGLGSLLAKFEQAGHGNVAQSWVSNGQNQPITPDALHSVFGPDMVQQLSAKLGLPIGTMMPALAHFLPHLVDSATPNGTVPPAPAAPASGGIENGLLMAGLQLLKSRIV